MKLDELKFFAEPKQCPSCGTQMIGYGESEGHSVEIDKLGVCFKCGSFLRLGDDDKFTLLTIEEIGELPDDMRIALLHARKEASKVHAGRKSKTKVTSEMIDSLRELVGKMIEDRDPEFMRKLQAGAPKDLTELAMQMCDMIKNTLDMLEDREFRVSVVLSEHRGSETQTVVVGNTNETLLKEVINEGQPVSKSRH